jgi:hypothetical protein
MRARPKNVGGSVFFNNYGAGIMFSPLTKVLQPIFFIGHSTSWAFSASWLQLFRRQWLSSWQVICLSWERGSGGRADHGVAVVAVIVTLGAIAMYLSLNAVCCRVLQQLCTVFALHSPGAGVRHLQVAAAARRRRCDL